MHVLIVAGIGMLYGPGLALIQGSEVTELTEGNPRLRGQVFAFETFARQLFIIASMVVIGFLIEQGSPSPM